MKNEVAVIHRHTVAVICINTQHRILIGHRCEKMRGIGSCYMQNEYTLPEGEVKMGETERMAAVRRLKEETGIDIKESDLRVVCNPTNKNYLWDAIIFMVNIENKKPEIREPEKIDGWNFYPLSKLPNNLSFPNEYGLKYLQSSYNPKIETEKVLTFSTAHIMPETDNWLERHADSNQYAENYNENMIIRHNYVCGTSFGWTLTLNKTIPLKDTSIPKDLKRLIVIAEQKKCRKIILDGDVEPYFSIPLYKKEWK